MDLILRNDLLAIRAKIDTPEKWTQGSYARDAEGRDVRSNSEKACRFCAMGAVLSLRLSPERNLNAEQYLIGQMLRPYGIPAFNDNHTHAEVMALFKELDV